MRKRETGEFGGEFEWMAPEVIAQVFARCSMDLFYYISYFF